MIVTRIHLLTKMTVRMQPIYQTLQLELQIVQTILKIALVLMKKQRLSLKTVSNIALSLQIQIQIFFQITIIKQEIK